LGGLLTDEDKNAQLDRLRKELAKLDWEEQLLKKRDDRLKWEQDMLRMEDGLKEKGYSVLDSAPEGGAALKAAGAPEDKYALEAGATYVFLEQSPNKSVGLFIKEVKSGSSGLYITRSNPAHVRKKFELGDSKVCWLTGVKSSNDVSSISGLQELSILVSNSIDENCRTVILLDGIEYLISNNDFPIVLRLIQQIRDKVSTSESKMIIPLNQNALEPRQLTLIERECHVLE